MEYAWPYITLICFYGILALWYHFTNDATKRGKIALICGALFLTFFGFRGFCFYDWNTYYPEFQSIPASFSAQLYNGRWYEPGFTTLMVVCKNIYDSYHFLIFVCSLLNTILFTRFLYKFIDNIPLGFVIFLCMGGLSIVTDLLRNSIAIFIFMNALEYIISRKPIHYFTACLIASTFHISALLYLPLFFILHREWGRWSYAILFIIGNLILLFRIPVFATILSIISVFLDPTTKEHIDEYTRLLPSSSFQISIGYIERIFTGIMIFVFYNKLKSIQKSNIFINCMILFFLMFFMLSEFRTISLRMSMLFAFAYVPIWIDLIYCFAYQRNKICYVSFLCIYCLIKIYSLSNNIIYNYDNVLLKSDSYNIRKATYQKNYDGD